jgi:hypothetical protein
MAVTNEALQAEIVALYKLCEQSDKHQAEVLEGILKQVREMNGRQREQQERIAVCDREIARNRDRYDLLKDDMERNVNRKTIYMAVIGLFEAGGALLAAVLTRQ